MVTQFVGFLAAFAKRPGCRRSSPRPSAQSSPPGLPSCHASCGSSPARHSSSGCAATALSAALSAITAAVVGVILNLAVWFGIHTLFEQVREVPFAAGTIDLPSPNVRQLAGAGARGGCDTRHVPVQGRHAAGARRLLGPRGRICNDHLKE
jgi:hypothetical protein